MKELRTLPDGSITYELYRKRVKNMNLRVTTSGVVRVSAPPRVPLGMIKSLSVVIELSLKKHCKTEKAEAVIPWYLL